MASSNSPHQSLGRILSIRFNNITPLAVENLRDINTDNIDDFDGTNRLIILDTGIDAACKQDMPENRPEPTSALYRKFSEIKQATKSWWSFLCCGRPRKGIIAWEEVEIPEPEVNTEFRSIGIQTSPFPPEKRLRVEQEEKKPQEDKEHKKEALLSRRGDIPMVTCGSRKASVTHEKHHYYVSDWALKPSMLGEDNLAAGLDVSCYF